MTVSSQTSVCIVLQVQIYSKTNMNSNIPLYNIQMTENFQLKIVCKQSKGELHKIIYLISTPYCIACLLQYMRGFRNFSVFFYVNLISMNFQGLGMDRTPSPRTPYAIPGYRFYSENYSWFPRSRKCAKYIYKECVYFPICGIF